MYRFQPPVKFAFWLLTSLLSLVGLLPLVGCAPATSVVSTTAETSIGAQADSPPALDEIQSGMEPDNERAPAAMTKVKIPVAAAEPPAESTIPKLHRILNHHYPRLWHRQYFKPLSHLKSLWFAPRGFVSR